MPGVYLQKVLKCFLGFDWDHFLKYLTLPCFLSKKTYTLLGLLGSHFTTYALVFQTFFIYLFILQKRKLTNIQNKKLIDISQH